MGFAGLRDDCPVVSPKPSLPLPPLRPLPFEPPSGCIFPLYQAVPPTATLRPVNIFYFPFWHIRLPFTFAVGRTSEMFANKRRERYTQGSIVPRIFVPFFSFIYFFIFFFQRASRRRGDIYCSPVCTDAGTTTLLIATEWNLIGELARENLKRVKSRGFSILG